MGLEIFRGDLEKARSKKAASTKKKGSDYWSPNFFFTDNKTIKWFMLDDKHRYSSPIWLFGAWHYVHPHPKENAFRIKADQRPSLLNRQMKISDEALQRFTPAEEYKVEKLSGVKNYKIKGAETDDTVSFLKLLKVKSEKMVVEMSAGKSSKFDISTDKDFQFGCSAEHTEWDKAMNTGFASWGCTDKLEGINFARKAKLRFTPSTLKKQPVQRRTSACVW